jgi:hypothetical protein
MYQNELMGSKVQFVILLLNWKTSDTKRTLRTPSENQRIESVIVLLTYEKCTTQLKTKSANDKMSLPSRNQMTRTNKHHFNTETHRKQERATYFPKWIPEPMVLLAIIISDLPKNLKH